MREEKIYFKNNKGGKLCGILTVPDDKEKKYPIVIMCHGIKSSKEGRTYAPLAGLLSEEGILSLRFDFSGHGESEGEFEDMTLSKGADDILSAIDYAKGLGYVGKIGLLGTSFGASCSIMAASKFDGPAAIALRSPAVDLAASWEAKLGHKGMEKWKKEGFIAYPNREGKKLRLKYSYYEDANKNNNYENTRNIKAPILILQGDKDKQVYLEQVKILKSYVPDIQVEMFSGENHYFDEENNRRKAWKIITRFFVEVLK